MTCVSVLFTRLRLGTHYTRLGSKVHNSSITAELYRWRSGHLVDDQLLEVVELVVPLVQGLVPGAALATPLLLQHTRHLINPAPDGVVEDAADQETLHVVGVDVELARDELDVDPGVGLDQLDQHLGADVEQQVLDVLPDEGVFHDGLPILLEYLLEVIDVIVLISVD